MKSLHEIKEEVAKEFHFINWKTLYDVDGISNVIIDEIAKRYANECVGEYSKRADVEKERILSFTITCPDCGTVYISTTAVHVPCPTCGR